MTTRRKRRPYGMALPRPTGGGARRGSTSAPSTCIACMAPIDLGLISIAMDHGQVYTHACGRVLFDPAHGSMEPML